MEYFLIDKFREENISYNDLVLELNNFILKKFVYFNNPKYVFFALIKSLALGEDIILLDGDLSKVEIENQGLNIENVINEKFDFDIRFKDLEDLYNKVEENKYKWNVTLFTSGTTGKPKKVKHNFISAARSVRTGERYLNNIWLFCYNPTHFAGLQVFLQAFLNKNTIILANDPSKYNTNYLLGKYNITNISATPTYYRYILPTIKSKYNSVNRITLGGEKSDESIKIVLSNKFPSAKITNVYASTEAGNLFATDGEYFRLNEAIIDMIKVENGELLVNKKLLGEFESDNNEWYSTGDIVEYKDGKIKFIQRKNDFINVGGYKVNPLEVEEEIMMLDNIVDVLVYGVDNKLIGKILAADVVLRKNEENINKKIFNHLNSRLQKWKIPRIINIKNTIEKTKTGKKVRNK